MGAPKKEKKKRKRGKKKKKIPKDQHKSGKIRARRDRNEDRDGRRTGEQRGEGEGRGSEGTGGKETRKAYLRAHRKGHLAEARGNCGGLHLSAGEPTGKSSPPRCAKGVSYQAPSPFENGSLWPPSPTVSANPDPTKGHLATGILKTAWLLDKRQPRPRPPGHHPAPAVDSAREISTAWENALKWHRGWPQRPLARAMDNSRAGELVSVAGDEIRASKSRAPKSVCRPEEEGVGDYIPDGFLLLRESDTPQRQRE